MCPLKTHKNFAITKILFFFLNASVDNKGNIWYMYKLQDAVTCCHRCYDAELRQPFHPHNNHYTPDIHYIVKQIFLTLWVQFEKFLNHQFLSGSPERYWLMAMPRNYTNVNWWQQMLVRKASQFSDCSSWHISYKRNTLMIDRPSQACSHGDDFLRENVHFYGLEVVKFVVKVEHPPITLPHFTERSFRTWNVMKNSS